MVKREGKEHRRKKGLQEKEEYLERNGYSQRGIVKFRERGEDANIVSELTTGDKQVLKQEQFNKVRNTKYSKIYKFMGKMGLKGKERRESQKLMARARCGNLEEKNKYWMSKDGNLCELCLLEGSTIKQNKGMSKIRENRV